MIPDGLSSFVTFVVISAFTPGPNNILCLGNAVTYGLRASIPMLCGLAASFILAMSLCGLATSLLAEIVPVCMPFLRIIGAAYILWLAYGMLGSGKSMDKGGRSGICTFWQAFALQFVNVKVILYGITAFTTFILPRTEDPWHLFGYALFLAGMGHAANWTWALAGTSLRHVFVRHGRVINIVLASALAYSVIRLFI